ncbi:MAG: hypothetical protein ASQ68_gp08 [Yellowstone Lake virophage 6]|uniref:hypothetical protein n=1 Tax=Yellowstone Lake virophage 6 TaxID=1557034 RepID=UPI000535EED4|nr:MAG: hypothetical protein ASQ68_gp08 [Yellowstone Lake virophage 6]AIW01898.1 MAG: hypothetical protein YSLV6_ORF08 [Yellowstone Lake virophage 6]
MSNYALINSPNALTEYSITNALVALETVANTGGTEVTMNLIQTVAGAEIPLIVPAGTYTVSMKAILQSTAGIASDLTAGRMVLQTLAGVVVINSATSGFTKLGNAAETFNQTIYFTHQERLVVPVETTFVVKFKYSGNSLILPFLTTAGNSPSLIFTPTF